MGARVRASYLLGGTKRNEPEEATMNTKKAGEAAKAGFYFNTRTWELDLHRKDGDALPGTGADRYLRVPAVTLVLLGPIMGFAFVVFMPFIGFALAARELGLRGAKWIGRMVHVAATAKNTTH
jgi:hypothetical protein